jgi:hypothetical protein
MEQMTHQVTDAFSLLSHLSNPILSTVSNQIYVFLKTKVDYRILIFVTKRNSDPGE